jgi:hypothetical protein
VTAHATETTLKRPRRTSAARIVLINAAVLFGLLAAIELAARALVLVLRGSATAGLQERTLNLDYEPFVMYGPGWDARFAAVPHDGLPTVMLVGGSTAEGFAPAILETALLQRFRRPVRVVNGAFGGYEARQEVVVASMWGPSLRPAVIVSLDGQNDLEHRLRVPAPGRFFLDGSYRTYLTRPLVAPLAWMLSESQAYNGLVRLQARRSVGEWTRYADALPVYASALHTINVVARGLGAVRLMVLQPFVSFKEPLAPEERAFTAYAYRDGVMRALYDHAASALINLAREDSVGFLDARPIYKGISAPLFTDDVHFRSARGYEILARAIADALPADTFERQRP